MVIAGADLVQKFFVECWPVTKTYFARKFLKQLFVGVL